VALKDLLEDAPTRMTGKPCSVGALLARLEGDELAALEAMLYRLGWSQRRIYDACTEEGYIVGEQMINRHRSQGCRCFKAGR
jgi:hypothetical protein